MKCHRLNELISLLQPARQQEPDLNLMQFIQKLANEAGYKEPLEALTDDVLIYHLKMRGEDKTTEIPGLKKITKRILKPHCSARVALLKIKPASSSDVPVN